MSSVVKMIKTFLSVDGWVGTGCGVWIIEVCVGCVLEELSVLSCCVAPVGVLGFCFVATD